MTPVEATPRKAMTPARRARIIMRTDGHCAYPECDVRENLEIDHIISLWMGGADEDSNLEALCEAHHAQKTRLDARMRAKARRILGLTKNKPTKRPIRSRGFDKTLTRTFGGEVKRRSL